MYPELFRIGPVAFNSYGILLAVAFAVGLALSLRFAARRGLERGAMLDLAIVIMISAIAGSRLLYVLLNLPEFAGRWQYALLPLRADGSLGLSGLIFLGGVMAAIPAGVLTARWKGLPLWKTADSIAPGLALGIVVGRVGCYLNGCCFGKPCSLPWAVQYPPDSHASHLFAGAALHPTPLYEAGYGLAIFLFLLWLERRRPFDSQLSAWFLILYGVSRFTVNLFRYHESHMFVFAGIEFNQIVSFIMLVAGIITLIVQNLRGRSGPGGISP